MQSNFMKLPEQIQKQDATQQKQNKEDLTRVVFKLAKFLFNKNLLEQFKKQHSQQKHFLADIEGQIEKPAAKKKSKKKKRQQKLKEEEEQNIEAEQMLDIQEQEDVDKRWKFWVKNIEEFMKNEYYFYENCYYKLKSASLTMFKSHFKLDVVNTRNNRRQQLILNKNKKIYWVNTMKIELSCEEDKYLVSFPSQQKVYIDNPIYLQAIKKYWNKATFYAVVPTTLSKQPCPEIIMIQFNY